LKDSTDRAIKEAALAVVEAEAIATAARVRQLSGWAADRMDVPARGELADDLDARRLSASQVAGASPDGPAIERQSGAAPATPVASPGLCRLMNAAILDQQFRAAFLVAPFQAVELATCAPDLLFGCRSPDGDLRFLQLHLSAADWAVVRRLPPAQTVAERWEHLLRLARASPDDER
jgi:hypothetical protein